MKYGSVCSGIEAATAAWHSLGWQPAFFSEIEPFPRAVLAHHYPTVPLHGDFTTIGADQYGAIDLLVGGTPCQSFSVAGLRGGLDDDRGNLALEFLRLADRKRPRWVVWENVPGVLSSNGGRDFGSILGGLGELGYGWAYRVLDAQYFGVAQRRRRVFVVGYLGDWRPAAAVLFERHSMSGHPAPSREKGKDAASGAAAGAGERGDAGGERPAVDWPSNVACTLATDFASKWGQNNQHVNAGCPLFVPAVANAITASLANAATGHNKDENVIAFDAYNQSETDGVSKTVAARNDQDTASCVAYPINTQLGLRGADTSNSSREGVGVGNAGDPAYTLQAGHSHAVAYDHPGRYNNIHGGTGEHRHVMPTLESTNPKQIIAFSSNMSVPDHQTDGTTPTLKLGGHGGGNPPAVAYSIMPMNSGKDYKARETEVAQPIMAGGPVSGNQGGDFVVTPFDTTQISSPHNYSNPQSGDPCHPLAAGAHPPAVAFAIQDIRGVDKAQNGKGWSDEGVSYTVDTHATQGVAVAFALRGREDGAMPEVHGDGDVAGALRAADGGSSRDYVAFGETARTLSARYDGSPCADRGPDVIAVAFQSSQSGVRIGDTHATLDANNGSRRHNGIATASAVRRLTPRECERLQGFPDNFTGIPWKKKGPEHCPDGPRYKALGNSMAVPVMRWIGERIQRLDTIGERA